MKRDKLEQLLHDKLNRMEIEPPRDMWAKLESDLNTAEVSQVESSDASDPSNSDPSSSPSTETNIDLGKLAKQGSSKVATAAYATAATIAFSALIIGGLYTTRDVSEEIADITPDKIEMPIPLVYDSIYEEVELACIPRSFKVVHIEELPLDMTLIESVTEIPKDSVTNIIKELSDIKPEDTFVRSEPAKAELGKRKRRTTPVSASIFASNFGAKNESQKSSAGAMLNNTGFAVYESVAAKYPFMGESFAKNSNVEKFRHKLPLSFGLSVTIGVSERLSLQTGVMYTYMASQADIVAGGGHTESQNSYSIDQKLHYLGVPISLKYDIIKSSRVVFYVNAGGAIERSISARRTYRVRSQSGVYSKPTYEKIKIKGVQTSVGANLGVEAKISNMFGIYIEPGVGYYFKNSHQPSSYRTEKPFNFTLKAGLRLHF